ncbi:MAG: SigE family RNA polymerase sigma factor [Micromonosporaceae bacterium]|nr:SigE family RNA polymerase sigma factor [Micromonosporaceae bacterium]
MRSDREYAEYVSARLSRLHRTAYLLCGDGHRADDIVQASLIDLYRQWRRASAVENLDAYLHRILVRRYLDERRRAWSRVVLTSTAPDRPAPPDIGPEERDAVMAALRALPKGQRAVLVLRYFCDLSVEATAEALGCSTGNVKSQCARGLATLREAMGVLNDANGRPTP